MTHRPFPERTDIGDGYTVHVSRFPAHGKYAVRVFLGDDAHPIARGSVDDRANGVEAARTFKALHRGAAA